MLFESYFNQVSQLSDEIQKMIKDALAASHYKKTSIGITVEVKHKKFPLVISFNMQPDAHESETLAYMRNFTTTTRFSIELKNGKKRRRILPVPGGTLGFNVANLAVASRSQIPFYSEIKPYIHEVGDDSFEIHNLKTQDFVNLCAALIQTPPFKASLAHEIQHNYNPIIHRKVLTSPSRNKRQQSEIHKIASSIDPEGRTKRDIIKYAKYAINDDEVNSAIAEAIAFVRHHNQDNEIFQHSSSKTFINECVAFLKKLNRWSYFTEDVKRKVIRRLSQTFYNMRQPPQA